MLGYDMSWASFHVVEVMSQPKFWLKRAGCLAASQFFEEDNDCIMLTTQLLKKVRALICLFTTQCWHLVCVHTGLPKP